MSIHHLDAFRFLFGDPREHRHHGPRQPRHRRRRRRDGGLHPDLPATACSRSRSTTPTPRSTRGSSGGSTAPGGWRAGRSAGWTTPWGSPSTLRFIDAGRARRRDRAALDRSAGSRTRSRRRWPRSCGRSPTAAPRHQRPRQPRDDGPARGGLPLGRRGAGGRALRDSGDALIRDEFDYVVVGARLGGLRGRGPAQRGPGGRGRPGRGRAERLQPGDPRAGAVLGAAEVDPRLGLRERARTGVERPPHLPAARPRPRRHQLDEHDALRARRGRGLRLLGAGGLRGLVVQRTCCRCSSSPRTTSAASPTTTAPAARSGSRTPRSRRCSRTGSPPPKRPATRATRTSTARPRTGSASTRRRSATAAAAAARPPTSAPTSGGRT